MMDAAFWEQRWQQGQIGFHQQCVTPQLEQYWGDLHLPVGSQVFVPLAGKSLDMPWLAAQGYRVLGVELSQLAVDQFFAEHELTPTVRESKYGTHHTAGAIQLIRGDAFALDADALSDCAGVYDRAALIALPPELRQHYAADLYAQLPRGCRGLLVTLEYAQQQMNGPPFSVSEDEVHTLYGSNWTIESLERTDTLATQPRFIAEGVTALVTAVYRLQRC